MKRPGKTPRPVVIAPVENRIVQRAIHDVLVQLPPIVDVLSTPFSFGGIKGKNREVAISAAVAAVESGSKWYVRSDIKDFFTKIPRSKVIGFIAEHVEDQEFLDLLERATETELENLDELGEFRELFPFGDIGMAQGSSLSLLMGNILLRNFDREMNGRGITCIRYCDDFILLGSTRQYVLKAFRVAQTKLQAFGMNSYDPEEKDTKASSGETTRGFDFLGCQIDPGLIQPSRKAREKILESVRSVFSDGRRTIKATLNMPRSNRLRQRFAQTVNKVSHIIEGWGYAYQFCQSCDSVRSVDKQIDQMYFDFCQFTRKELRGKSQDARRRVWGLSLLQDIFENRKKSGQAPQPNPLLGPQAALS